MLIAKNSKGKMIKILNSVSSDTYTCPVCGETLERKFGVERQYFAHPKGIGDECEIKMKLILKDNPTMFDSIEQYVLENEYYKKEFKDIHIELSDYMSEEGYPLTEEQKKIIFSKEDRIKINALAGSAKSSTLYYYAKERPFKKILYLVYNKSMQLEAQSLFGKLRNVDIRTIHSLAYGYVGVYYKNKLSFNYNAVDVIKDLNLDWDSQQDLAVQTYEMFKSYMLSNVSTFNELEIFNDEEHKLIRPLIISICERLWELKKNYNNNIKMEHDMYLKLFQLSHKDLSNKYDIILLDESQDGSELVLDILFNSKVKGLVMVGDPYQALYGWRLAKNIMPLFNGKEYKLTTSFRVSQQIANIANMIIEDCSDNKIHMKGFNVNQKIVDKIDKTKPYACLCRTNSYIFAEVIDAIRNNHKKYLYFEGGYQGYRFENIRQAYYFYLGHETKNSLFSKFKNFNQMKEYADNNKDLELLSIIKMIDNYGSEIPYLVDTIKENTVKDKKKADVIFSTIHKAKGMTFKMPILVSNDHYDLDGFFEKRFITNSSEINMQEVFDEMAIIYVVITRCANEIELSDNLKKYLLRRYDFYNNKELKNGTTNQ